MQISCENVDITCITDIIFCTLLDDKPFKSNKALAMAKLFCLGYQNNLVAVYKISGGKIYELFNFTTETLYRNCNNNDTSTMSYL